jgi:hypothetical protein
MGRLTTDEAAAALAAMLPHNRADVESITALPKYSDARAIHFAKLCHQRQWSRAWAAYVWEVAHPVTVQIPGAPPGSNEFDDDIPF